jgi:hypothetical protein
MEKKLQEVSAQEKREARFQTWLSAQGVKFQSPEAEATYKAAITRFKNAVLMEKIPDRVPVFPLGTFMQGHLYGVTTYESMYDYPKLLFSTSSNTDGPATECRKNRGINVLKASI